MTRVIQEDFIELVLPRLELTIGVLGKVRQVIGVNPERPGSLDFAAPLYEPRKVM